jgi:outer membrane receptor protein involved in Fe transport
MKTMLTARALAALSILFICTTVSSQSTSNHVPEVSTLTSITVTAGRGSELENLPISTTVINREEVLNSPEQQTDQIINKIPGVFINQIPSTALHPTGSTFSIRGFGTSTNVNTLVMVDGIPFNDPFFRTVNWARIPKNSIESLEVIRGGGATSLWGNLAMGGVVNIVTRPPQDDNLSVYADYGSFNTLNTGFSGALFKTDKVSMGISYDYAQTQGYNATPEQYRSPYMTATGSQVNNLTLYTLFTPSANANYYAKLNLNTTSETTATWENASNKWNNYVLSGGGTTRFEDNSTININAWGSFQQMKTTNSAQTPTYNIFTPGIGKPYVSQNETDNYQSYGMSVFYQKDFGQFKDVKFGVDGRMITSDDNIDQFASTGFYSANLINKGQNTFQGLFITGTYQFKDAPVDINFGLREDFYQVNNSSLSGTVYTPGKKAAPFGTSLTSNSYASFDPSLGIKYYANDYLDLRAAVYRNFAAPGMNQLYRTFLSGSSITIANPNLAPQTNFGQEIGFDLSTKQKDASLSLTLFNNNLSNFIDGATMCTTAITCNPLIADTGLAKGSITQLRQNVNAGSATLRGYELLTQAQIFKSVRLNLGFTQTWAYLNSSDYDSGSSPADPTNAQLGQVPPWMLNAGIQWQASAELALSGQIQSFPAFWNNTAHTQLNDGATLVNIGFRYQIEKNVQLYGTIQNVFNTNYLAQGMSYTSFQGSTISSSGVPALAPPRWFTLGVRATF